MKTPLTYSALQSFLLTVAVIAVNYFGWLAFGLPYFPFDLFDWIARQLPGAVITAGIDAMVKGINVLNLGDTASAAKTAEKAMALLLFLAGGTVAGVLVILLMGRLKKSPVLTGTVAGSLFGLAAMLISLNVNLFSAAHPVPALLWALLLFAGWGFVLGWAYQRLQAIEQEQKAEAVRLDRRRFMLKLGGATAVVTVVGVSVGALLGKRETTPGTTWSATHALPNAGAAVEPAPGTRPEFTPLDKHYRIDINTVPPEVNEQDWKLNVTGLVEKPLDFTLDELKQYEPMHQFVTLECISNRIAGDLISTTRWTGVSLQQLLPDLHLKPGATHLKISSADGFYETVALQDIINDERIMLTYAWDGLPLKTKHGFPLRIYIPNHYGMKQPKWIETIEALDHWEKGYWVTRGWDREAIMKSEAVIDAVAVQDAYTSAVGQKLVPVGGIAFAGDRGISKVELQVDNGDWHEAQLRKPLSQTTWVIWRYDMPFQAGEHTLTARCYDGEGKLQTAEIAKPHPSGATGYHVVRRKL
ncbi:molybdopterin-dependent oxidoreductase [Botryobacter ruber]|uniref:molybdopterin-dependent oxidoreductase n=1 Tax=Botryobacter ruber TaxID=2171629 RepID=UPI000E0C67EC|nr:molybdopterin-dependent oxidoreductase [Botryobacter ruber]